MCPEDRVHIFSIEPNVWEGRVIARLTSKGSYLPDFGQGRRGRQAPHGTSKCSHFSTPTCNRQRQAVTDGINSHVWILRWTMIPQSSLWLEQISALAEQQKYFSHTSCSRVFPTETVSLKKPHLHCLFFGKWQVIWEMGDSCIVMIWFHEIGDHIKSF